MKNPIELTDEEKRELLKPEKNLLLKVKDKWDSLNPQPYAKRVQVKGDQGIEVGLKFSF